MHGVHEMFTEGDAAAPEAGALFGPDELFVPQPARTKRPGAEHEQGQQHRPGAFVRMIAPGAG